ncbi:hypothetical protein FBU30_011031 [Linnemannia zychae]|nr:hypothetical protein FBU30_011031 [Linnemannia zychae]
MKRRYTSENYPGDPRSAGHQSNGINLEQHHQEPHLEPLGPGTNDITDHLGSDIMEGRVLKKMKRIKLTSDSVVLVFGSFNAYQLTQIFCTN